VSLHNTDSSAGGEEDAAPLHQKDIERRDRFSVALNASAATMSQAKTVILIDSNGNGVTDKTLDKGGKTHIITVGGVCLLAALESLRQHTNSYPGITKVLSHIGTNDCLHSEQHCVVSGPGQRAALTAFEEELHRIFPRAKLHFNLPFTGLPKVSGEFIDTLHQDVMNSVKHMVIHKSLDMTGKVTKDGVHLSREGKYALIKFLQRFVPKHLRPKIRDTAPAKVKKPAQYSYSGKQTVYQPREDFSGNPVSRRQAGYDHRRFHPADDRRFYSGADQNHQQPYQTAPDPYLVKQMAEALSMVMSRDGQHYSHKGQWRA
jgi:hypothetical protein